MMSEEIGMLPQPKHLGPIYGSVFQDDSVVEAYQFRPPYPDEVFRLLTSHVVERPRRVLDVGCGTGHLARRLAPLVQSLDAIDLSRAMIDTAKRLEGGDQPNLHWIQAPVETAPLSPPYDLITAGESLHWLAWDAVFPRFVGALSPAGALAIVNRNWDRAPAIRERLYPIISKYSTNREYRPYNLVAELEQRELFEKFGEITTSAESWQPTIADYVELRHSQNGLSRERMGASADAFDREIRLAIDGLIQEGEIQVEEGRLQFTVDATIVWGKPCWPGE
jgi:SAM-dependent methyltransferase